MTAPTPGVSATDPEQGDPYRFDFAGRSWACREVIPEHLWRDFELIHARSNCRQSRKAAGRNLADIVRSVVVDVADLAPIVGSDQEAYHRFLQDVVPDLLEHYRRTRARIEGTHPS